MTDFRQPAERMDAELAAAADGRLPSSGGLWRLRFQPELEAAFRGYQAATSRTQARVVVLSGVLILLLSGSNHLVSQPAPLNRLAFFIEIGLLAPFLLSAWALSYLTWFESRTAILKAAVLVVLAGGLQVLYAVAQRADLEFPYEGILLILMANYFAVGLRFAHALAVGLGIGAAFTGVEFWLHPALAGHGSQQVLYILIANLVGAVGAFSYEGSLRRQFLAARALRNEADRDGLTGLRNRRYLDNQLPVLWGQARRERAVLAGVFLDVDFFKAYNDAYGHLAGDDCLRAIGCVLAAEARRPLDLVVRYGGEEFLLLWFDPAPMEALPEMADAVRGRVEALHLPHCDSPISKYVTVSCGAVAVVPDGDMSPGAFVERMDQAMYEAKRRGRNRTVVATDLAPDSPDRGHRGWTKTSVQALEKG